MRILFSLLPFVFFLQTRYPLFNPYQLVDYLIGYVYLRDVVVLLFVFSVFLFYRDSFLSWLQNKKWFIVWAGGLYLFAFVSSIGAFDPTLSFFKSFLLLLYICFALTFGYVVSEIFTRWEEWLVLWFIPFGILAFIAVGEVITGGSLGLWILGEWDFSILTPMIAKVQFFSHFFLRPYTTFPHPNVLGGVSALFLIIALWTWMHTAYNKKWLLWICMIWVLVILSFSRSAWIGLACIFLLVYVKGFRIPKGRPLYIFIIVGLVSCALAVPYFLRLLSLNEPSINERLILMSYSRELLRTYPLFGVGYGNFIIAVAQTIHMSYPQLLQPVHNSYILMASEIGLPALVWFVFGWVHLLFKTVKNSLCEKQVVVVLLWLIIFLTSLLDHYWWSLPIGQSVWWLVVGLSLSVLKSKEY